MEKEEPQVKVSQYSWDCRLPFPLYVRTFTNHIFFGTGVLSQKEHGLELRMDAWTEPRYDLVVPIYPDARFHIPEAKVQLISGNEVKNEVPLAFISEREQTGKGKETLRGRIPPPFLSPVEPEGPYRLRLLFTVELQSGKGPVLKELNKELYYSSVPEKSDLPELLFRKAADVKIVCGKEEFVVHKELLTEKSPVFRQMFESEMTESLSGKVVLDEKEISPSSVLQLLHFLYTGKMEESKEVCKDLFVAAEKYDMQELKARCENFLAQTLIPEDAAEFYELAETHQGEILVKKALRLLKKHKPKLFPDAAAFQNFTFKYPQLVFQLFTN